MAAAVQAPYNPSPAYSGNFIPQLWSGKLNVKFYAATVFGEIANTDYEGEIKALGDKIRINNVPSIIINNYTVGQVLSSQVPAPSVVDLTIDTAKYFNFQVSDVLAYQSKPNLMATFSDDATKQMAIAIDRDVLLTEFNQGSAANKGATAGAISGAFNLGTDTAPVTITSTNVVPLVTAMSSVLDEQNVPDTDRWLLITPYFRQVLMASPLSQAYVTGDQTSMLRNGKIGAIDRFKLYVSNQLPAAAANQDFNGNAQGGAVKRTAIMAGHKSAITFASQITKVEQIKNPNDFGELVRGLNVYGKQAIKPEGLVLALQN
jgi:hypothetical protein